MLGFSGPSVEDGIGLFLSAFLLLGLIKALGWLGKYEACPHRTHPARSLKSHPPLPSSGKPTSTSSFPIVAHLIPEISKEKATPASLTLPRESKVTEPHFWGFTSSRWLLWGGTLAEAPGVDFTHIWFESFLILSVVHLRPGSVLLGVVIFKNYSGVSIH